MGGAIKSGIGAVTSPLSGAKGLTGIGGGGLASGLGGIQGLGLGGGSLGSLFGSDFLGGGGATGELQTRQFPGVFGSPESADIASQLRGLISAPRETQPFAPQSASEQAIIDSLIDLTQGQTATRGLGPATQGSLAQAIAPTLTGFRQQEAQLGQQRRAADIGALLELAGLAMPQIIAGQQTRQTGPGLGFSLLSGAARGAGAAAAGGG